MFPTGTKTDAESVSMEELQKIRTAVSLPIVVIGGINKGNAGRFKPMGIDGLCCICHHSAVRYKSCCCGTERFILRKGKETWILMRQSLI